MSRLPKDEEEEAGAVLSRRLEHTIIAAMMIGAVVAIVAVTEPFAEALIATGQTWGSIRSC